MEAAAFGNPAVAMAAILMHSRYQWMAPKEKMYTRGDVERDIIVVMFLVF